MDFNFTETQGMLRDTLHRYLADTYDFDKRAAMLKREGGRDPGVWKALATELGILGAALPEQYGGFGGTPIDSMVLMEEFGRAIAVEPYVPTVVLGDRRMAQMRARGQDRARIGDERGVDIGLAQRHVRAVLPVEDQRELVRVADPEQHQRRQPGFINDQVAGVAADLV